MTRLLLIRGLPGSGKSTLADKFTRIGYRHFEADMFFLNHFGDYEFDSSKLKEAHEWCQNATRDALANADNVVVSNTFSRLWEMKPYLDMCADVQVIECQSNYGNIHGVPVEAVLRMRNRWEPYPV